MTTGVRFGPIPQNAVHLCVDMQRLFADPTFWQTPWMARVLPTVVRLCEARAAQTCFTRFLPVASPDEAWGQWRRYWRHWAPLTLEHLDPGLVELVPELRLFTPPARVVDKLTYSPWTDTDLAPRLRNDGVDCLVVSGAETDVCVLATVLGAVDLGFRVVIVSDAVCSSSDKAHDALVDLYHDRFSHQIETAECDEVLDTWA